LIFNIKKNINFILVISIFLFFVNSSNHEKQTSSDIQNNSNEESELQRLDEIDPYCDGIRYSSTPSEPNEIKNIDIEINQSRDWYQNFLSAYLEEGNIIKDKYKKRYSAEIIFYFDDFSCSYDSEVRISGDFKDHLYGENFNPSFDVRLLEGNILNVTKFKLFLPSTRNSNDEVFFANLMKELGFLSPKTFYVNVTINNNSTHKYIFQEKINKEFIESNKLRESALFESNENIYWEIKNNNLSFDKNIYKTLIFGKVLNSNWVIRNYENLNVTLSALERLNLSLIDSRSWWNINPEFLTTDTSIFYQYDAAMISGGADHGLVIHNRKFYFDYYVNEFFPVYYDGMPDFTKDLSNGDSRQMNLNFNLENYNPSQNTKIYTNLPLLKSGASTLLKKRLIDPVDFQAILVKNNLNINLEQVVANLEKFYRNLNYISNLEIDTNYFNEKNKNIYNTDNLLASTSNNLEKVKDLLNVNYIFIDEKNLDIQSCTLNSDRKCTVIDFNTNNIKSILDDNFGSDRNIVIGKSDKSFSTTYLNFTEYEYILINASKIYMFGKSNFEFDEIKNELHFYLGEDSSVLITSDYSKINYDVYVHNSNFEEKDNIFDPNLLTGCLNFYKVQFDNNLIHAENQKCEDAVNIVNSTGFIKQIKIKNSSSDALDADFSNIEIDNLEINKSGNDCLDFSYGNYKVFQASVNECGDKGLSIGEVSNFELDYFFASNIFNGIAVKDSSKLNIKNGSIENTKFCISAYRKKQEFGPAMISYTQIDCDIENYFIQRGSEMIKNE
tara:strand:+ start:2303 stop:4648 length:2346 start_codon:yes stop_codon:yes gene_type:complete